MFVSVAALRSFSAVCWLFAEYLYPHTNHPIGLIESSWGGTIIEAWSSPEALHTCSTGKKRLAPPLCMWFMLWLLMMMVVMLFVVLCFKGMSWVRFVLVSTNLIFINHTGQRTITPPCGMAWSPLFLALLCTGPCGTKVRGVSRYPDFLSFLVNYESVYKRDLTSLTSFCIWWCL